MNSNLILCAGLFVPAPVSLLRKTCILLLRFSFVLAILSEPHQLMAQFDEKFGQIAPWERDLKVCDFDKEANAAILLSEGYSDYNDQYNLITTRHVRIKVLRESGIDRANISIHFQSEDGYQYITDVKAKTFNIDENGHLTENPVEKKSIYTKPLNKYFSKLTFAFPQVRVGSILEYSYRIVSKNFGALHQWAFQDEIPVYQSSYKLNVVPNLVFSWSVQKAPDYKVKIDRQEREGMVFFEMKNIPGLDDEPYMDSREDYVQKVDFQISSFQGMAGPSRYMENWKDVCRTLNAHESFGRQTRLNVKEIEDYIKINLSGKDSLTKMRMIYDLIRHSVKWDRINSLYAVDGVKTTWAKKTGSTGSMNLLLINALRAAGLQAYPILVSERGNGTINMSTPFVDQFSAVYAIVMLGGHNYYLDAREGYTPAHLIPSEILNTTAFIVDSREGKMIHISDETTKYSLTTLVTQTLGADGQLSGTTSTLFSNYARDYAIHEYGGHQEEYIKRNIKDKSVNIAIDSFAFENLENDTVNLGQKFAFNTGAAETGEYTFVALNSFSDYRENPFSKETRFSNINFGYGKAVKLITITQLPDNMVVDVLPKNISMSNPSKTIQFTRYAGLAGPNIITSHITINISQSWFEVDQYPEIREFYKKMIDFMNEQVVLKKITK